MKAEEFLNRTLYFKDKAFRFARKLLGGNPLEAEDIVQEAYLRLWQNQKKLETIKNIEAFAMTIVRNLCIDKMRSKSYNANVPFFDEAEDRYFPTKEHSPLKQAELKDTAAKIESLIAELPEKQRAVFSLRDMEGYSISEIDEIMGIGRNAVKVNLSRARKKIRNLMSDKYGYTYEN